MLNQYKRRMAYKLTNTNILRRFSYDFKAIDSKWQTFWNKNKIEHCDKKEFKYVLGQFPYPSG